MFEILLFLFENYLTSNAALKTDTISIATELEKIGFDHRDIHRALRWLDGLTEIQSTIQANPPTFSKAMRHYLFQESEHIGSPGKELLIHLENMGVLDPTSREIVIDRIMALPYEEVTLGHIKYIILMVLFNQPEKKAALFLMQDIVMADGVLH